MPVIRADRALTPAEIAAERGRLDTRRELHRGFLRALELTELDPTFAAEIVGAGDRPSLLRFVRECREWLDQFEAGITPTGPRMLH